MHQILLFFSAPNTVMLRNDDNELNLDTKI